MKAVRIHEFGGPEVLKYEDAPDPELRKDQVVIRIRACALNHLDLWVRKGLPGVKLPHILGSDIAGEVAECGEYITDVKPGTRVLLSPMLYCGHCEQCFSGRQNFCPQFAVLGNNAEGGKLRTNCCSSRQRLCHSRRARFCGGRFRAPGLPDRLAHAGG